MAMSVVEVKFWNLGHDASPSIHQQILADRVHRLTVESCANVTSTS
jgi:hypothetical protein